MVNERQVRYFPINSAVLMRLMHGTLRIKPNKVPKDFVVTNVFFDVYLDCWCITVQSSDFAHIPEGMRIPMDSSMFAIAVDSVNT